MTLKTVALVGLVAFGLTACASYEPDRYRGEVNKDIETRTRYSLPPAAMPPAPLEGAVSTDTAVRAAVRYNRALHAALEELNIAAADELEAGLLFNPVLAGEIIFEGDGEPAMLDFGLAFNLGRLLTLERRKDIAAAERQQTQTQVTEAIVRAIADAKLAVNDLWLMERRLALAEQRLVLRTSGHDTALILYEAGNATDGALADAVFALQQAQLDVASAKLALLSAREHLANATGTPLSESVSVAESSPGNVVMPGTRADYVDAAVANSLWLQAARFKLEAGAAGLGLANMGPWFDHMEAELRLEREDGDTSPGIGASVPIPFFDTGSARAGRARAFLSASEHRYQAQLLMVRNRAEALFDYLQLTGDAARGMRARLLEAQDGSYAFSEQLLNAMQLGPLRLLAARERQIDAQRRADTLTHEFRRTWFAVEALKAGTTLDIAFDDTLAVAAAGNSEGDH